MNNEEINNVQPDLNKAGVSGSLSPFGFIPMLNKVREWVANNNAIPDADYDKVRLAISDVTRIILKYRSDNDR